MLEEGFTIPGRFVDESVGGASSLVRSTLGIERKFRFPVAILPAPKKSKNVVRNKIMMQLSGNIDSSKME